MEYIITFNNNDSITLSTIHKNHRRQRTYYGYTCFEAGNLFYQWIISLG